MKRSSNDKISTSTSNNDLINFFDSITPNETLSSFLKVKDLLFKALEKNQFYYAYQPKFSLNDNNFGQIVGVEALLRWKRQGEVLPTPAYINLFEDGGFIIPLGDKLLSMAINDSIMWKNKSGIELPISLNLQLKQLESSLRQRIYQQHFQHDAKQSIEEYSHDLLDYILGTLKHHNLSSDAINFEIVERRDNLLSSIHSLSYEHLKYKEIIQKVYDKKIKLHLDDFLKEENSEERIIPGRFYSVKTDISNIRQTLPYGASLVNKDSLIFWRKCEEIKEKYKIPTIITEGIETIDQLAFVKNLGFIDNVQGYLFSPPISYKNITSFISDNSLIINSLKLETSRQDAQGEILTEEGKKMRDYLLDL